MVGWLASLGSFFRLKWKAILVIVVGLILVFVIWQWRSDIQDRVRAMMGQEQLMQAIEEQKETIQEMRKEQKRRQRINEKYEQELEEIKEYIRSIRHEVRDLEKQNEKVADWADNRVPDAVLDRLRDKGSNGSNKNQKDASSSSQRVDEADKGAETSGGPE
jgi:LysB family phage lysis regulatory protein